MRGLFAVSYLRMLQPSTTDVVPFSFRFCLDRLTAAVAAVGAERDTNSQSVSPQRTIPQGEGLDCDVTAGRASGDGADGACGRAFAQLNAAHAEIGAGYIRASRGSIRPGHVNEFVSGSVGAVAGSVVAARPVQDSLALIRIPAPAEVPMFVVGHPRSLRRLRLVTR